MIQIELIEDKNMNNAYIFYCSELFLQKEISKESFKGCVKYFKSLKGDLNKIERNSYSNKPSKVIKGLWYDSISTYGVVLKDLEELRITSISLKAIYLSFESLNPSLKKVEIQEMFLEFIKSLIDDYSVPYYSLSYHRLEVFYKLILKVIENFEKTWTQINSFYIPSEYSIEEKGSYCCSDCDGSFDNVVENRIRECYYDLKKSFNDFINSNPKIKNL